MERLYSERLPDLLTRIDAFIDDELRPLEAADDNARHEFGEHAKTHAHRATCLHVRSVGCIRIRMILALPAEIGRETVEPRLHGAIFVAG